ncbi:APC family permease [Streptomyces sp. SID13666]|uniref:amino acid permease n=1 Tax=unclassified Streptomyces TaxID=2593676 RepID=UPI0013BEBF5B|nr:APC family permease [Streptomyces sp. SID13666]NEA70814.1 APC family permease [Streptomyces sp. SID13588]
MARIVDAVKRLVIGRALPSEGLQGTLLPKRLALPIFASDPLSSVAYATQEILLVLTLGGLAYLHLTTWVAMAVVGLMAVVVLSYRQVVHAYPSGGGSYEVVATNLGPSAGLVVAASLLVDYVMTVAVSVASGVDNIISAIPSVNEYRTVMAVAFVALLAAINLRGTRESGRAFAAPTYLFIAGVLIMCATGLFRWLVGDAPVAESAAYGITPEPGDTNLAGLALLMLGLRAFSSGCTALTGVEAISNGVPAFRKPKSRNAASTMTAMGLIAVVMFSGITALAMISDVHITEDTCRLTGFSGDCATTPQRTVIAQLAAAIFGGEHSFGFFFIQAATALVLVLAANTAFNGFPLLSSILAQHRYLPRQLHTRGDRLAFSNGIVALAVVAGALLWAFHASVTNLIHLYILGVFTSFTLSQTGMVRHWNRALRTETDPAQRRRHRTARVINGVGAFVTGLVLVIVLITKFTEGAYLAVIAAVVLWVNMRAIRRHYDRTAAELAVTEPAEELALPARVHAIVLVSKIHKPTLRALAYARACRPDTLEALTVDVDRDETKALQTAWDTFDMQVPLKTLASPYREITRPVVGYVRSLNRASPRDIVSVFIPEYVVGHWWENGLHNQSALWLKSRLLFTPGVMVISVPWQLSSSQLRPHRPTRRAPGSVRRGEPDPVLRAGVGAAAGKPEAGREEPPRPGGPR